VHAVLRSAGTSLDAVAETLASHGLDVGRAEAVAPSLEDVFLDVVDHLDREGAA
jgi:hypothetical protein